MDRRRAVGVLLVVVSACGFGSGALFAKPVYAAGLDWLTLLAWRFAIGAALAWGWLLISAERRAELRRTTGRLAAGAIALGAVYTLNSATYFAALETVPASLAALIVYIYPVLVAVLTLRIGRPLRGRGPWIALGVATAGAALAVGGIDAAHVPPIGGILLAIASPIIYSCWIVFSARLGGERRDRSGDSVSSGAAPAVAGALMMTTTGVIFWLLALGTDHPVFPGSIAAAAWPGIVGIGVVSTFIAIQTFYAGARRVGAAQAALISTIEPVYTITFAALLFAETLTGLQLVGAALILGAVVVAQSSARTGTDLPRLRVADE
ncbi:MAG TPA: DMT family transporter [Candidatus Acidoferrum sp.]|nr:DMT family transporter [Candidatus Acidoferrum sp.]